MAGATTIGLGLGVILLIVLWTVTAFLWVLLSSSQTTLRVIVTCLALLLTFSLFIIPTSEDGNRISLEPPKKSYELYDYMFIGRALLIIFLLFGITAGLAIQMTEFWGVKVHGSSPIPKRNRMQIQQSPFLTDEF